MKTCTKCNQEKKITEFRLCFSGDKSYYRGECKECYKTHQRETRKEYRKKRYEGNKDHHLALVKSRRLTEEGKEIHRISNYKSIERYPEKQKARVRIANAISSGKLQKGECAYPNGKCKGRIEAHHWDYSKPLDIVWFCKKHHILADNVNKFITNQI